jgi:hypothetical protein
MFGSRAVPANDSRATDRATSGPGRARVGRCGGPGWDRAAGRGGGTAGRRGTRPSRRWPGRAEAAAEMAGSVGSGVGAGRLRRLVGGTGASRHEDAGNVTERGRRRHLGEASVRGVPRPCTCPHQGVDKCTGVSSVMWNRDGRPFLPRRRCDRAHQGVHKCTGVSPCARKRHVSREIATSPRRSPRLCGRPPVPVTDTHRKLPVPGVSEAASACPGRLRDARG